MEIKSKLDTVLFLGGIGCMVSAWKNVSDMTLINAIDPEQSRNTWLTQIQLGKNAVIKVSVLVVTCFIRQILSDASNTDKMGAAIEVFALGAAPSVFTALAVNRYFTFDRSNNGKWKIIYFAAGAITFLWALTIYKARELY